MRQRLTQRWKNTLCLSSIQQTLTVFIIVFVLTAYLLTLVFSLYATQSEINEVYDAQLAQSAKLIAGITGNKLSPSEHNIEITEGWAELDDEITPFGHKYETNVFFSIFINQTLVATTRSAPFTKQATHLASIHALNIGYHTLTFHNIEWRVFIHRDPVRNLTVVIGEQMNVRKELAALFGESFLVPVLILLPFLLLGVLFSVRKGLHPLKTLSDTINQQDVNNLISISDLQHTQANTDLGAPIMRELQPIITSLDALLKKVNHSYQREKQFTSHAAHELRTPLAGLRVHLDNLSIRHTDTEDQKSIAHMNKAVDNLIQLTNHLLQLNRISEQFQEKYTFDLSGKCSALLETYKPNIIANSRTLIYQIEKSIYLNGEANYIDIIFKNVFENFLKYTPTSATQHVTLTSHNSYIVLAFYDDGPGIPDNLHSQLGNRFFKHSAQHNRGSGLGLSIIKEIAHAFHAEIQFTSHRPHGFAMTLTFLTNN